MARGRAWKEGSSAQSRGSDSREAPVGTVGVAGAVHSPQGTSMQWLPQESTGWHPSHDLAKQKQKQNPQCPHQDVSPWKRPDFTPAKTSAIGIISLYKLLKERKEYFKKIKASVKIWKIWYN